MTVLLSIFAHGLSALPGMELNARQLKLLPPGAPENEAPPDAPASNPSAAAPH